MSDFVTSLLRYFYLAKIKDGYDRIIVAGMCLGGDALAWYNGAIAYRHQPARLRVTDFNEFINKLTSAFRDPHKALRARTLLHRAQQRPSESVRHYTCYVCAPPGLGDWR